MDVLRAVSILILGVVCIPLVYGDLVTMQGYLAEDGSCVFGDDRIAPDQPVRIGADSAGKEYRIWVDKGDTSVDEGDTSITPTPCRFDTRDSARIDSIQSVAAKSGTVVPTPAAGYDIMPLPYLPGSVSEIARNGAGASAIPVRLTGDIAVAGEWQARMPLFDMPMLSQVSRFFPNLLVALFILALLGLFCAEYYGLPSRVPEEYVDDEYE